MEYQRVFTSRFVMGTRTTTSFPGYSETRMRRPTLWAAGGTAATLRPNLVLFVGLTVWEGEAGSAGRRGALPFFPQRGAHLHQQMSPPIRAVLIYSTGIQLCASRRL